MLEPLLATFTAGQAPHSCMVLGIQSALYSSAITLYQSNPVCCNSNTKETTDMSANFPKAEEKGTKLHNFFKGLEFS